MDWSALHSHHCPKCQGDLWQGFLDTTIVCTECSFKISEQKYNDIVARKSFRRTSVKTDYDDASLGALNNLGHDVVTEDFSDSPFKT